MKTQIISKEIYEKHLKRIFELMQTEIKPNSKESNELETISILVRDYENEVYPMNKEKDLDLLLLMQQANRADVVSREEIMKALE